MRERARSTESATTIILRICMVHTAPRVLGSPQAPGKISHSAIDAARQVPARQQHEGVGWLGVNDCQRLILETCSFFRKERTFRKWQFFGSEHTGMVPPYYVHFQKILTSERMSKSQ